MAGRWLALGALLLCAAECFAPATRHAAARRPRQPRSTLSPPEADEARADAAPSMRLISPPKPPSTYFSSQRLR